jgi:hypothetical protein
MRLLTALMTFMFLVSTGLLIGAFLVTPAA